MRWVGWYPRVRGGLEQEKEPLPGSQAAEGWSVVCEVGPGEMKLGGGLEPDCKGPHGMSLQSLQMGLTV